MRFDEFNLSEDIKLPGKPQPGGASDGVVSHTPMKLGPIKYDLYDGPPPTVKQSASSNLPVNYQIAPNMRPQPGPPKPVPNWVEKSALGKYQDPADISQQQTPAYQRKGTPEPITKPAPGTKPTVDLSNPRQAAAYKAQLDLEKAGVPLNKPVNNTLGAERPGTQAKPNYSLANDPVGKATAGEPSLGKVQPAKAPASTSTSKPVTATAQSQYQQAMNTVANMRKGFGKSNEYTNIYAPLGPTSFQNKQYIQDLEKEFRKTPNDPIIRAELDKMRGPGIVAAKGTGTAGGRTTDVNDPRLAADIRPGSDDIRGTGRGPGPGMKDDPRLNPNAGNKEANAVKPPVSTGNSTPAKANSTYQGSAGAQAIQQANANKIADVNKIRAGDTIQVGGQDYTIKPGDTLDSIAKNQQSPAVTAPSTNTDVEKTSVKPTPDMAEDSKSLNRIKSLAGLK